MGLKDFVWKHQLSLAVGCLGFVVNGVYLAYEYEVKGQFPLLSPNLEHIIIFLGMPLGVIIGQLIENNMRLQQNLKVLLGEMETKVEARGKELRDVTRYLDSVIQNAGDAIILADAGGNIMSWNRGAEKLLGFASRDAVGENLNLIVPEDLMDEFEGIFQKVITGGRVVDYETKRKTKDGRVLDVFVTVSPITDDEGVVIGTSGIITDITELKTLQRDLEKKVVERARELKESEEKYRALVENANDGIYVRDLEGRLTFVNRRYADIYGYEPQELIGRNVKEFKSIEDYQKVEDLYRRAIAQQKPPEIIETKSYRKNGSVVYLHIRPSFVYRDDKIVGIQGIVRDITLQKAMERELSLYAKELEKASRLKDLYIDIIHHDLLNPLGIIRNLAEFILKEDDPDKVKEYGGMLYKKIEDSVELVENAAKFRKIEGGNAMDMKQMDLAEMIRGAMEDLEGLSKEKDITLTADILGKFNAVVNPLMADVFSNLLSNAIKYSPEHTKVTVSMEESGSEIKVMVKDQGEGVPDEYKEQIFKRFERRMKEGVKGTGLGLAIVKRVVELHRGRTWVEDNPGGGSVFIVTLPK